MWFTTFVLANILGRPVRSTLTTLGVGVAVTAVVALVGVARDFQQSLLDMYRERGVDLLVYQAGKVQISSSVLPESLGQRIRELPGVREVTPCLYDMVSLIESDVLGVPVQGVPADSFLLRNLDLVQGRVFGPEDRRVVLLGAALAEALGARAGDEVELLEGEPFRVLGVFHSYNVFESGAAIAPLEDLQRLMLREGEVTAFFVVAASPDAETVRRVGAAIERLRPGVQARRAREVAENTAEMRLARSIAWLTSVIALIIGSIGMLNTMLMAVFERTRELAMLRAIGWGKRRILRMVLSESLLLSLGGALLGSISAVVLTRVLSRMPAAGRLISGHVSWEVIGQGFAIAVLLGLLGGLYPAWSAARLPPIEGLRHD